MMSIQKVSSRSKKLDKVIWKQEGRSFELNNPELNHTSDDYVDSVVPENSNNDNGEKEMVNKLNLMTNEINHEIHND
ncbi:hypothetical protein [Companilactobacillus musae]|uniref:hypothetical protein n=1 Tax=Companilactobacillus musae TaxID=1903258 RepID=UPI000F840E50|nr:hypothetical protein [Companilactobacillus musae]